MLLEYNERQVAAFARAPRKRGGASQFFQGAPAAEHPCSQISGKAFRSRFAPPVAALYHVVVVMRSFS
jgi:hypothetical protein